MFRFPCTLSRSIWNFRRRFQFPAVVHRAHYEPTPASVFSQAATPGVTGPHAVIQVGVRRWIVAVDMVLDFRSFGSGYDSTRAVTEVSEERRGHGQVLHRPSVARCWSAHLPRTRQGAGRSITAARISGESFMGGPAPDVNFIPVELQAGITPPTRTAAVGQYGWSVSK